MIADGRYAMADVCRWLQMVDVMADDTFEWLQVVDMRWGVRDEATDDHMTTDLCMKEIDNCQRLSMGPNFCVNIHINIFNPILITYLLFLFTHMLNLCLIIKKT